MDRCKKCLWIYSTFDVNGPKAPNKYGYDAFRVTVFSNKVNKGYWDVYGGSSLYSILQGGKLIKINEKIS